MAVVVQLGDKFLSNVLKIGFDGFVGVTKVLLL